MFAQRSTIWVSLAFSILLALSVVAGCGPTPQPTPTATPTSAPIALVLDVNPNVKEIEAGKTVAIVARVSTGEEASLTWSVEGTSGGELSSETGDAVFYTAGDPGADIVTAEGSTADGAPVKERVSFNVVAAPTDTPVPPTNTPVPPTDTPVSPTDTPVPPTDTPVLSSPTVCDNFTSIKLIRPPLPLTSSEATASFSEPQHCDTGLPAGEPLSVGGTATNVPEGSFLWLLVYTPDTNYYPQCDNAGEGRCGANLSGGIWAVKTYIGREGCKEHFHLVLVSVNQSDNDQLAQEMIQRDRAGDYGFERSELPASVEEIASIEVETAGSVCD